MAYAGLPPAIFANNLTNVQLIDDISGSFNGSTQTFALTSNSAPFHAVSSRSLLVTLGGITQKPNVDYIVDGGNITFTTAPVSGLTFAARNIYGLNYLDSVNDGAITPIKLSTGAPTWNTGGTVTVSGDLNVTGSFNSGAQGLFWGDNEVANFGDGNDLKIYHDGSNSYIDDVGTGNLIIGAANFQLMNVAHTENYFTATNDGSVKLYYDGSLKFETTSDGFNVSNGSSTPVVKISGPAAGSSALEFYADTTKNGALLVNNSSFLIAADNSNPITFNTGGQERLHITSGGSVGINTNSPQATLDIWGNVSITNQDGGVAFSDPDNKVEYHNIFMSSTNNSLNLNTYDSSWGTRITILKSGNVGIGTESPDSKLHVYGDITGRVTSKTLTINKGTVNFGETDTFTLNPDVSRIYLNHSSTTSSGTRTYTANINSGLPTTLGSIIHLEIYSYRENTGTSVQGHQTTIQFNGSAILDTGYELVNYLAGANIYERTLRRSVILTSEGWVTLGQKGIEYDKSGLKFSTTNDQNNTLSEKLTISNSGNVGIGTDNPDTTLHIEREIAQNDNVGILQVESRNANTGSATNASIIVKNKYGFSQLMQWESNGLRLGVRSVANGGTGDLILTAGADGEKLRITSTGNVGVGTNDPPRKLTVWNSGGNSYIGVVSPTTDVSGIIFGDTSDNTKAGIALDNVANRLMFMGYDYSEAMCIDSNGNVGIGTNLANGKFDIYGNAGSGGNVASIIRNVATSNAYASLYVTAGNTSGQLYSDASGNSTFDGSPATILRTTSNSSLHFGTNNTTRVLINTNGDMLPAADDTYDLGAYNYAWKNIYTGDLHLSNESKESGNSVDGTHGNWTIQEGSDDLYLLNNKNGKKYKFVLQEV